MKRAILVGLAMVCLVIYLVLLNGESVDFRITHTRTVHWNVGALIGGAFVIGVLTTLAIVAVQAGQRALRVWRTGRREKRRTRIDQWEESGEQLIWNGDAQRGRALLQKAWVRRPEDSRAVLALAASFCDTGELHRARGVLFDAAAQHHTNPDLLMALARAHRSAGEIGPSIEALERLRALHPRAPRVLKMLRDTLIEVGRWGEAAQIQDSYLAEVRDPQQVLCERELLIELRYLAALELTDPAARLTALENLSGGRNVAAPILVSLGDCLIELGRPDEASAVWERGLRSTPRSVFVERLAGLASETRHRDRIRSLLRKVRSGTVNNDHLCAASAMLHLADRNPEEAARELETIQGDTERSAHYQRIWAEVYRQRGQTEQALAAYARSDGMADRYECRNCHHTSAVWVGFCRHCRGWDSYRSVLDIGA